MHEHHIETLPMRHLCVICRDALLDREEEEANEEDDQEGNDEEQDGEADDEGENQGGLVVERT